MKKRLLHFGLIVLALTSGCRVGPFGPDRQTPDGVRLLTLSAIAEDAAGRGQVVRAFVEPTESPAITGLRFELYEFAPLTANPRGRRLMLWTDIEPAEQHWRKPLRAYEFVLPLETPLPLRQSYLLEVTAFGDDGLRRSDLLKLTP